MEVHHLILITGIINMYFGQSIILGAKKLDTTSGLYNLTFIFIKIVVWWASERNKDAFQLR